MFETEALASKSQGTRRRERARGLSERTGPFDFSRLGRIKGRRVKQLKHKAKLNGNPKWPYRPQCNCPYQLGSNYTVHTVNPDKLNQLTLNVGTVPGQFEPACIECGNCTRTS